MTQVFKPIPYHDQPLVKDQLLADPIHQFDLWFRQAKENREHDHTAMTLATVNQAYDVTARMVLLKDYSKHGFVFFTNYDSPKGLALGEINKAALVFWWPICQRQVRITGTVNRVDPKESDAYFSTRDRERCLAAIASKQSEPIPDREALIEQYEQVKQQYDQYQVIPRPAFWGGFIVDPQEIEFWQGRTHRLHDRFRYRKTDGHWIIEQLSIEKELKEGSSKSIDCPTSPWVV